MINGYNNIIKRKRNNSNRNGDDVKVNIIDNTNDDNSNNACVRLKLNLESYNTNPKFWCSLPSGFDK